MENKVSVSIVYSNGIIPERDSTAFNIAEKFDAALIGSGCNLQGSQQRDLQFRIAKEKLLPFVVAVTDIGFGVNFNIPESPLEKIVLGHVFRPMSKQDWYGFAGAEPGTLICHVDCGEISATLLLIPDGTVEEHRYLNDDAFIGIRWAGKVVHEDLVQVKRKAETGG